MKGQILSVVKLDSSRNSRCDIPNFNICYLSKNLGKLEHEIFSFKELSGIEITKDVKVKIDFVVDKRGKIKDVKLKKSSDVRFNDVAMRVFLVNLKESFWTLKR